MKGIIYSRVSSDEQVKGTSLDDQERRCRAYCEENGIEVVSVFREEGASAKTADRKQLLAAIEYCRTNVDTVDVFVVFKLDRFARNVGDHYAVRKILKDYGVELRSTSEQIGEQPAEKFMEAVIAAASEYDNDLRRSRTVNGMTAKLREGIWPWKAPMGYIPNPKREQGGKKTLPDVADPSSFPILQTAFREFAEGEHTQASFAQRLDNLGLATIRGKKTSLQFVQMLLLEKRLKFYVGVIANSMNGNEDVLGLHQPMLSRTEYENILGYLHGKKKPTQHHVRLNPNFPLRGGTVLCGACKRPVTGSVSRGRSKTYAYYHCYTKGCESFGKAIQKDTLESAFVVLLNKATPTAEFVAQFKNDVISEWANRAYQIRQVRMEYESNKRALEAKLERIKALVEDGTYSRADYLSRKQNIENELLTMSISSNESHIEQLDMELLLDEATAFLTALGEQWKKLSPMIQPRFQKLVYPDGISYTRDTGFGTAQMGLIFELNKRFTLGNYSLVDLTGFEPVTPSLQMRCSTK